ncbi:response regulator [Indioceanicola profundi]|uniref:response regulator n=1 Tax=Indioceanicola profundi TaxID=2220096 RepID=UPI0013C4D1E8|nr:response regulator [Indioceanicola profundi]
MLHVLIAEDEPLVREMFAQYLTRAGYRVTQADDGAHGLALIEDDPADIIITDFKMPRMNGADFLRAARARRPGTPAVVISAFGHEVGRLESLGDGETRFCGKPVSPKVLCHTVEELLSRRFGPAAVPDCR